MFSFYRCRNNIHIEKDLLFNIKQKLGKVQNYIHDKAARTTSSVDDLIMLHYLLKKEYKLILKQKKDMSVLDYQRLYLTAKNQLV